MELGNLTIYTVLKNQNKSNHKKQKCSLGQLELNIKPTKLPTVLEATKLYLVVVLHFIGSKDGTANLDQSQSKVMQKQSNI